ncbi:MAG TPA: hypothetical protein P5032_12770 [Candidatus Competibacter sp.]|nr:hypothetical protein [Candidatus Competibacter sp.]
METKKLMVLVEAGAVRSVEAIPDGDGWAVWITYASLIGERREPLQRQRGGVRVFVTLDAVARCLVAVGLSEFAVNLPGKGEELP